MVHEVESLFCLPVVVSAVCDHTAKAFHLEDYSKALQESVNETQRHKIIIQRWKARLEPNLMGVVARVSKQSASLEQLVSDMPTIFNVESWSFSPQEILEEEKKAVEAVLPGGTVDDFLIFVPGKQLLPIAARFAGLDPKSYASLIVKVIEGEDDKLSHLRSKLVAALEPFLPVRQQAS